MHTGEGVAKAQASEKAIVSRAQNVSIATPSSGSGTGCNYGSGRVPDAVSRLALAMTLLFVAGKLALSKGHLWRARNSLDNAAVSSRMRAPYSTEGSISLPSCHSFHEVIKTLSGAAAIASCESAR